MGGVLVENTYGNGFGEGLDDQGADLDYDTGHCCLCQYVHTDTIDSGIEGSPI